jgi:SAM-dependent methyltransferase
MNNNIVYQTQEIDDFYSKNRQSWDGFYKSEQWIFEEVAKLNNGYTSVLDIGCAAGGLGKALEEKFGLAHYMGIDINPQVINSALDKPLTKTACTFICGDILKCDALNGKKFDTVISLSAADWNVETNAIIEKAWDHVSDNGFFIISLRLTPNKSLSDISKSYQYIVFDDNIAETAEVAPYVIFNINEAIDTIKSFNPQMIKGYGYWGAPSSSARTRYDKLVFAVFALQKGARTEQSEPVIDLELPDDLFNQPL